MSRARGLRHLFKSLLKFINGNLCISADAFHTHLCIGSIYSCVRGLETYDSHYEDTLEMVAKMRTATRGAYSRGQKGSYIFNFITTLTTFFMFLSLLLLGSADNPATYQSRKMRAKTKIQTITQELDRKTKMGKFCN